MRGPDSIGKSRTDVSSVSNSGGSDLTVFCGVENRGLNEYVKPNRTNFRADFRF